MKTTLCLAAIACALAAGQPALAQDVRITTFKSDISYTLNGRTFTVSRDQNTNAAVQGDFALTSRACPPHCLQPLIAADGVVTLGELELLDFLQDSVSSGTGLLLDARAPDDFALGSIPGGVNVPFTTLAAENRYRDDILRALGAVAQVDGTLDFSNAMVLAVYSGGVWSNGAPTAITHLLGAGYPAAKLFYYRGGLQTWAQVGLTITQTQNPG